MGLRLVASIAFSVLLTAALFAQDVDKITPVTQREADTALVKTYTMVKENLGLKAFQFKPSTVNKPLTREQLVDRLHALYVYCKPKLRVLKIDAKFPKIASGLKPAQSKALNTLLRQGFVNGKSRLITSSQPGFSPAEFGTTIGNFLTQVSELSFVQDKRYYSEPSGLPKRSKP